MMLLLLSLLFDWLVFFPSSVLSVKMKCEHNRTEYKKILYHIYVREWERKGGLLVVKVEYDVHWVWESERKRIRQKRVMLVGDCEKENFFYTSEATENTSQMGRVIFMLNGI